MEQWADRGSHQQAQVPQAPDVWPREHRTAAAAGIEPKLNDQPALSCWTWVAETNRHRRWATSCRWHEASGLAHVRQRKEKREETTAVRPSQHLRQCVLVTQSAEDPDLLRSKGK